MKKTERKKLSFSQVSDFTYILRNSFLNSYARFITILTQ